MQAISLPLQPMAFEFKLLEKRVKPYQVKALHILAGLAMDGAGSVLYMFMPAAYGWSVVLMALGVVIVGLAVFRNRWLRVPVVNTAFRMIELLTFASLVIFSVLQEWVTPTIMYGVLALAMVLALFWEHQRGQVQKVFVDDNGVKLPIAFRKRNRIAWHEIESVLLRFGVLTVDCVDNRFYQWNIDVVEFSQESFEMFCTEKIEGAKHKRLSDW